MQSSSWKLAACEQRGGRLAGAVRLAEGTGLRPQRARTVSWPSCAGQQVPQRPPGIASRALSHNDETAVTKWPADTARPAATATPKRVEHIPVPDDEAVSYVDIDICLDIRIRRDARRRARTRDTGPLETYIEGQGVWPRAAEGQPIVAFGDVERQPDHRVTVQGEPRPARAPAPPPWPF